MPRTYHSVNLSQDQQVFQKLLSDYEVDIFSISEIENILKYKFDNINTILENLVSKNFLSRIEQGKYCRANFRDEKVIGCFIASNGTIAYWSALNIHGLTEQFPNIVFIQTDKVKKNKDIFGINYRFVKVLPDKIAGISKEGYGNRIYRITDVEKTIIDCFDFPSYSGGYAELIRAFNHSKLISDKLISYATISNNIATTKRMGFLAEFLDKKSLKGFIQYAKGRINERYNLIDPLGIEKGEFVKDWRIRLNISRDELMDICNKQY